MVRSVLCACALTPALAAPAAFGACTQTVVSVSGSQSIAIQVAPDTVVLRRLSDPGGKLFTVTAIVRNTGSEMRFVSYCGPAAERYLDGVWVPLLAGDACMGGWYPLAPGDSLVRRVDIYGFTEPRWQPPLDPRLTAGTYRLRFAIGGGRDPMDPQPLLPGIGVSPEFTVVDPEEAT